MRLLTLREYGTADRVALSPIERDELRRLVPSLSITPSFGADECYDLRPGSFVGVVRVGDLAIEIRPKLPIDRLLFLISYTLDRRRWREVEFDLDPAQSLIDAIVPGFVAQVRRATRRGVLQGYRVEEEALLTIRGRVRFDDQIKRRFGRFPPAEVRYDDYTEDIEENRLLKAAITRLKRLPIRSDRARHALRAFDLTLAGVQSFAYDPRQLPEITWTHLNERYRPAVALAKLILRSTSFDTRHGQVSASAFLVDMNQVFEDFVVLALRDALRMNERTFPQGAATRSLHLDHRHKISLKPDISWWSGSRCQFVGDVKYKRVNAEGVLHPDLYQLLAYSVAANLPGGLLIYAAGEDEPARHDIVHVGKQLEVVTLNLSGSPESILAQIDAVASRVNSMAEVSLSPSAPPA